MNKIKLIPLVAAAALLLHPAGGRWAWLLDVRWLYVFVIALLTSYSLTEILVPLGHGLKILDQPAERKMHASPVPRIGGFAIFAAVIMSIFRNLQFSSALTSLIAGSSIIYAVGLIDDIRPQRASIRLLAQLAAALVVLLGGVRITSLPTDFPAKLAIEYVITIVWLIGIANAVNFLDGINGLASGMTALCALLFFLVAFPTRQSYLAYTTMALAGGCIGFMPANLRGRIFLGDAGATFIGFLAAGIAVMGSWAHKNPLVSVSTPLLILSIPIFDMIYTTVSRIKNRHVKSVKEWLEYTGKDHLHHRLITMGFGANEALVFILLLNLLIGFGAMTIRFAGPAGAQFLLVQTVLLFVVVVMLMLAGRTIS